jgi:sugar (pentulose or hexulose) kinase
MFAHYHTMKVDQDEFVELSESTNWWNDYDFEQDNWSSDDDVTNTKQTFDLIENKFEEKISFDYERIASFYNRLYLLDHDESIYF